MPRSAPSARSRASATLKWTRPGAITPTFTNPEKCLTRHTEQDLPAACARSVGLTHNLNHISRSAGVPKVLERSNVAVSNLRPNSRARRQELFNSACDGRRPISAYLSRYLPLVGSQKLSGWN